jgi:hypothetical protein
MTLPEEHWLFLIKARSNNLPLRYRAHRVIKGVDTNCRHCGYGYETQAHIFNHCTLEGATRKHNAGLYALGSHLRYLGFDVDIDVSPVEIETSLRPDLIIRDEKNKVTHLLDFKTPYDETALLTYHRDANTRKYSDIRSKLSENKSQKVTLGTISVGCLGSWDPSNDVDLKILGLSQRDIDTIIIIVSKAVIRESYQLFIEHIKTPPRFNPIQ